MTRKTLIVRDAKTAGIVLKLKRFKSTASN